MDIVVPANDPTAVVVYSRKLFRHAIKSTVAAKLMALNLDPRSEQNFVQYFDELEKGPGADIKVDLVPNPVGPGVLGDNPIAGQEVGWETLQDTFVINQQRQAELLKGRMSQQRVPYSMRDAAKVGLANWWKTTLNQGLLNQLAGNTAQTNVLYTGLNAAVAPDANHLMFGGNATSEATLDSADTFTLDLITKVKEKAQTGVVFPIKPIVLKGVELAGVLFLHPKQVRDLKTNFSAGQWGNIQLAAMQGGKITGNAIFTGAIGMIDDIVLHQDAAVPWGDNTQNLIYDPVAKANIAAPTSLGAAASGTTSVARAVFVGAQAAAMACGAADTGGNGKPLRVRWYEELLDAGNQLRVTSGMVYGIKKTVFNSEAYASIVISTWAAP